GPLGPSAAPDQCGGQLRWAAGLPCPARFGGRQRDLGAGRLARPDARLWPVGRSRARIGGPSRWWAAAVPRAVRWTDRLRGFRRDVAGPPAVDRHPRPRHSRRGGPVILLLGLLALLIVEG